MHADFLAITLLTAHNGRHYDQLVLRDKVADASLSLARAGGEIELEGGGDLYHK